MSDTIGKIVMKKPDGTQVLMNLAQFQATSALERTQAMLESRIQFFDTAGAVIPPLQALKLMKK